MNESVLILTLRIDWSDLDAFGHVNNLAILRYSQSARINFMEALDLMAVHRAQGIGPVLVSTSCQFRKQLHYPGTVTLHSHVDHVKTTSFHMRHKVLDEAGDCVAEMHDVLVMYDFRKNSKHAIPAELRERMIVS
jgi:acyl-CoA thioester hydrolase